jgi:peptidyl-prolyl cis-trans isomerase B (cyclophilin B)
MKKSIQYWIKSLLAIVFACGLVLTGCSTPEANSLNMDNYIPRLEGTATVEMTVNGSPITIEVDGNNAPITAGNFVDLVDRGFYNGLTNHLSLKVATPKGRELAVLSIPTPNKSDRFR